MGATLAGEDFRKLIELMAYLRGPRGCPWDREQDYDSMKGLLLEEVYEVIDSVNARDFRGLEDELGDLLFQVAFYARLAEEEGRFSIDDVIERVHAKLIRRHPHVFGEVQARNAEEALKSWLAVKEQERASGGKGDENSLLDAPGTGGATGGSRRARRRGGRRSTLRGGQPGPFSTLRSRELPAQSQPEISAALPGNGARGCQAREEVAGLFSGGNGIDLERRQNPRSPIDYFFRACRTRQELAECVRIRKNTHTSSVSDIVF
jgi:NTP pyrophosphatase (non-canonical NTP hydrolase)